MPCWQGYNLESHTICIVETGSFRGKKMKTRCGIILVEGLSTQAIKGGGGTLGTTTLALPSEHWALHWEAWFSSLPQFCHLPSFSFAKACLLQGSPFSAAFSLTLPFLPLPSTPALPCLLSL